tara:strand:+ start:174 stop:554 length:381 start_codon:yes stop_codon:yes gene_type:complete
MEENGTKERCRLFNFLLGLPGVYLTDLVKGNYVQVVSPHHMADVQIALTDLAYKVKYDRLRFSPCNRGVIWCDFDGRDGNTWRALLSRHLLPVPPHSHQMSMQKIHVNTSGVPKLPVSVSVPSVGY